ncbi:MAG: hypothetical protein CVV42_00510 [Candidatus Riflebacteria bacterium HGW-Riflebacteria-2]|nr:MAG: hypothetical protein CVV42_00510 [Candidatus Riflebacteria bacterium HGW-Riflebacteria-2]
MTNMYEDHEQNQVVEGIDLDDKPGVADRVLLVAALLISLPIYLILLFLFDDPMMSGYSGRDSGQGHGSSVAQRIPLKGLGGMSFKPQQLAPINSEEELLKELICTFAPKSGSLPERVYLRAGTYERFTANGMDSWLDRTPDKIYHESAIAESTSQTAHTADLHFFCNYEERLLHVPVLKNLAGPLKFCAMRDGSFLLDQTIAVGDEFELAYLPQSILAPGDVIGEVPADSPYLSTSPLMSVDLLEMAGKVSTGAAPGVPAVLKIVDFLETHGEYNTDFQIKTGEHPVREFLLTSMTGHCQHFSAALVLLCRLRGIPARVAGGYVTEKKRDGRFFVVSGMAHAWAEILTTGGWKIVDVHAKRGETPPLITSGVALPKAASLDAIKNKLKQENAQRMPHRKVSAEHFENAQTPGTVVKDQSRVEKHQREEAEKLFKKQTTDYGQLVKDILRIAMAFVLIAAFSWLVVKKFERLLKWLQKLFARKADDAGPKKQDVEEFRQNIENLLKMSGFVLEGCDVTKLFNDFTTIMAERGVLPRNEYETPGEYFERICLDLNLRPADGHAAAQCFEAEFYGGNATTEAGTKKFLLFLQHVLTRLN